jgi:hypothetical protein
MYENRKMKPIKIAFRGGERIGRNNRGSEFDLSILYECMEISQ